MSSNFALLQILIWAPLLCFSEAIWEGKGSYQFSRNPIDVVIPTDNKDHELIELCLSQVRKNILNLGRIIVVSPQRLTNSAEWFDESLFPFSKKDVGDRLRKKDTRNRLKKPDDNHWNFPRLGWYYQQLLKFYAPFVIPDISPNVLIVDADVVFLKPIAFQNDSGSPVFIPGTEYHAPYFDHMARLLPGLRRVNSQISGISHHQLFQRPVLKDLFQLVEDFHQKPFWAAFCDCVDAKNLHLSGASEYEIYLNFLLLRNKESVTFCNARWRNVPEVGSIKQYQYRDFAFVACHHYLRPKK